MRKDTLKGTILLLITAFIWGVAFVSQSIGTDLVGPFTFSATRMLLGAVSLLPVIIVRDVIKIKKRLTVGNCANGGTLSERFNGEQSNDVQTDNANQKRGAIMRTLIIGGIVGVVFCAAANFQQYAFVYSSAGKIAFITAMYILFVPFITLIFKKKIAWITWVSVFLGLLGMFFLCVDLNDIGSFNTGDLLAFVSAFFFALHILSIEKFSPGVDGLKLSCLQFFVGGIISLVLAIAFENPKWSSILGAWVSIVYAGVLSCGVAYTLQIIGQKYVEASFATLIMSMESVFAVLASAVILKETMRVEEIIGCIIMFVALILPAVYSILREKSDKKKGA